MATEKKDNRMLTGKCALVTGSTGGIGFAVAEALARAGCHVVLNGFGAADEIEAGRRRLETEFGVSAIYHGADLAKPDEIAALVESANRAFGAVDILVNNAVVRHFAPIDEFPVERWNQSIAVNLSAAFHTVRLALPKMRERNWGRIVNMSSGYGYFAEPNRVDYVTTKTALLGFTRAVAVEVARHDITCNALCPGTVLTPAIEARIQALIERENLSREAAVERYLAARQPSGRFIAAENIAGLVLFLCGPAGGDITGASLPVDGGWIAS
jgi:3-hydroxybutyrate dehydrogenase